MRFIGFFFFFQGMCIYFVLFESDFFKGWQETDQEPNVPGPGDFFSFLF